MSRPLNLCIECNKHENYVHFICEKCYKKLISDVLTDLHFVVNGGSVESEREEIIKKWEARSK